MHQQRAVRPRRQRFVLVEHRHRGERISLCQGLGQVQQRQAFLAVGRVPVEAFRQFPCLGGELRRPCLVVECGADLRLVRQGPHAPAVIRGESVRRSHAAVCPTPVAVEGEQPGVQRRGLHPEDARYVRRRLARAPYLARQGMRTPDRGAAERRFECRDLHDDALEQVRVALAARAVGVQGGAEQLECFGIALVRLGDVSPQRGRSDRDDVRACVFGHQRVLQHQPVLALHPVGEGQHVGDLAPNRAMSTQRLRGGGDALEQRSAAFEVVGHARHGSAVEHSRRTRLIDGHEGLEHRAQQRDDLGKAPHPDQGPRPEQDGFAAFGWRGRRQGIEPLQARVEVGAVKRIPRGVEKGRGSDDVSASGYGVIDRLHDPLHLTTITAA